MRRTAPVLAVLGILILICGCSTSVPPHPGLVVIASIPPLEEFAGEVGGDAVNVSSLLPPGADPHTFEPLPSDLVRLSRAQVFIVTGAGIPFEETVAGRVRELNPDLVVVNASANVTLYDRDPHDWLAPDNAIRMVDAITGALCQEDPGRCTSFQQNRDRYTDELRNLDTWIRSTLAPLEQRTFIVTHPAWGYYARAYDLQELAIEQEGKEAPAAALARLVETAREKNIHVVFVEPQFSSREAVVLAQEIQGRVVPIDPLARKYRSNLELVTSILAEGGG